MSRQPKPGTRVPSTPVEIKVRLERAMSEGRFQQALELARELYKNNPTPAVRATLHTVYLGRARQQRSQGQLRDAAVTLQADLHLSGFEPAWMEAVIRELAHCGELYILLQIVAQQSDPAHRDKLLVHAADAAVQYKQAGRDQLPEALRPDCDRVLLAFAQLEKGQDEAVKETLQAIGLKSPFLEWKVLLRGLQAYYQKDDVRALDNWQRLNAERFPYRLIAPLRASIDEAFRNAQPPATQVALQRQIERLQPAPLVQQLRQLQALAAREDSFSQLLRQLEAMLPTLRAQAPQLIPKLATALYQMLVTVGEPDDIPRYQRVLGAPAHDPSFNRLKAIGWERGGNLTEAHKHWQKFEQEIADKPALFPGAQANRARALIWEQMGNNAKLIPNDKKAKRLPAFLRDHPGLPKALKPGAEECFRRGVELAPEQLHTHRALFTYLVEAEEIAKALKAGNELLQRFPDDLPTLVEMAELHSDADQHARAIELLQHALRHNPLDRSMQQRLGTEHLFAARAQTLVSKFDAARVHFQAAHKHQVNEAVLSCAWAACELKAQNEARAEELLTTARQAQPPTAVAYRMVIEAIRLKLPAAYKKRFEKEWAEGLAQPPVAEVATEMLQTTASLAFHEVTYTGQKGHRTKVQGYVRKAADLPFTAEQYTSLLVSLRNLKMPQLFRQFVLKAQHIYPTTPEFWLIPALVELEKGPGACNSFQAERWLELADEHAQRLPPGPQRDEIFLRVQQARAHLDQLNPFRTLFGGGFPDIFGGPEDDADDDF